MIFIGFIFAVAIINTLIVGCMLMVNALDTSETGGLFFGVSMLTFFIALILALVGSIYLNEHEFTVTPIERKCECKK